MKDLEIAEGFRELRGSIKDAQHFGSDADTELAFLDRLERLVVAAVAWRRGGFPIARRPALEEDELLVAVDRLLLPSGS